MYRSAIKHLQNLIILHFVTSQTNILLMYLYTGIECLIIVDYWLSALSYICVHPEGRGHLVACDCVQISVRCLWMYMETYTLQRVGYLS